MCCAFISQEDTLIMNFLKNSMMYYYYHSHFTDKETELQRG